MKKKIIIILFLICNVTTFSQNKNTLKQSRVDELLECLGAFVNMTDQEIAKTNAEYNFKINFDKKFKEIDSLITLGITSRHNLSLVVPFKNAFNEYRYGDKQKAITDFKILINKGFAPATIAYITTLKENDKDREKYIDIGYEQCSEFCRALKMELLFSKKGIDKNIPFPKKCQNN